MSRAADDSDAQDVAIRDEFEFHVTTCADELTGLGLSPEEARAEAMRRFGSFEVYGSACRREAPEETMGRTTAIAMTAGLAVMAGTIGFLVFAVVRQGETLARIETRLASAAQLPASNPESAAPTAGSAQETGLVFVDGDVHRPGVYELPGRSGWTASRLIAAAGVDPVDLRVFLTPRPESPTRIAEWKQLGGAVDVRNGEPCMVIDRTVRDGVTGRDPELRAGDLVWIARQ